MNPNVNGLFKLVCKKLVSMLGHKLQVVSWTITLMPTLTLNENIELGKAHQKRDKFSVISEFMRSGKEVISSYVLKAEVPAAHRPFIYVTLYS